MKPKDHKVTQTFQPVLGSEPHKLTIWDKADTCIPDELTCEEAKKMKANDATHLNLCTRFRARVAILQPMFYFES